MYDESGGRHILRLRPSLSSISVALLAGAVSIGIGGCWYAALQLAPIALNVAEDIGSGVVQVAAGTAAAFHHESDPTRDDERAGEATMDRQDRCSRLELQTPGVIELRTSAGGVPEYRELRLGDAQETTQWTPLLGDGDADHGWRPMVNSPQMDFTPPLVTVLSAGGTNYLAYAPTALESTVEHERLVVIAENFGATVGTFQWSGRGYQYAVSRSLPCFPAAPDVASLEDD